MVRTVIALPKEDKDWLDREAAREGVSMTELVRRAVALLRQQREREQARGETFEELLEATFGIWGQGDALEYVRRIREDREIEPRG